MRGSTHKRCTQCLHTKPLEDFHHDYRASDEHQSQCKACTAEYQRVRDQQEREEVAERRLMSYIGDVLFGDMSHEDFIAKPKALWRA